MLEASNCYVCGIDRDPDAIHRAQSIKKMFPGRFDFYESCFSKAHEILAGLSRFNAVFFDFGLSSFQLSNADRGFAFSAEGRLDMRMSKSGISAFDVVNSYSIEELTNIIYVYGEETEYLSKRIAIAISNARHKKSIETTIELKNIVHTAIGRNVIRKQFSNIDTATKTFQAIRIFVNDELREISNALNNIPKIICDGAKIVTISFHALEDRIVKNWAKDFKGKVDAITKTVIMPSKDELRDNPRSRSAKLRCFVYHDEWKSKVPIGEGII
jgi:16S rRNA (cytosine1402-N4)-methyltransferase